MYDHPIVYYRVYDHNLVYYHSRREKVAIYMLFLKRDGSNNDFVLSRAGFVTKPFEFERPRDQNA